MFDEVPPYVSEVAEPDDLLRKIGNIGAAAEVRDDRLFILQRQLDLARGSMKVYHFKDNRTHKCGDCRQRFSIKVGTIFEDSKLPLRKWFMAIWLVTSHKKGIASTTLAKDLKITQKTAWFVLHRLRHAAQTRSFNRPLSGEDEVDETFIGGKAINEHSNKRQNAGRGPVGKVVVFDALERGRSKVPALMISSHRSADG